MLLTQRLGAQVRSKSIILYPVEQKAYPITALADGPWPNHEIIRELLADHGICEQVVINTKRDHRKVSTWMCVLTVNYLQHTVPDWSLFLTDSLVDNLVLPDERTIIDARRTA